MVCRIAEEHLLPVNSCLLKRRAFSPAIGSALKEIHMDLTALLIILLIVVLGGGFYGRGRWF